MYLAIDIGGTKTLAAVLNRQGEVRQQQKFPTPTSYPKFLDQLEIVVSDFKEDFSVVCCALPGRLDREAGIAIRFGNLPWTNLAIVADLEKKLGSRRVLIENDAKLAGLSEALLVKEKYNKVLYLTFSTGVGGSLIIDGEIAKDFRDMEPGGMVVEHEGKLQKWEHVASGKALFKKYGLKASEITDPKIWQEYVVGVALGLNELISTLTPEVIIIGGGVGAHFEKFEKYLMSELKRDANDMVPTPPIVKARRAEEAVIYGCYDYIKQNI